EIESDQYFFRIGEIADDATQRMGENLEQCGHGDDLLLLACLRMQIDVDDLKRVTLGDMLRANPAHVLDRQDGARGLPAYVETQHIFSVRTCGERSFNVGAGGVLGTGLVRHRDFPWDRKPRRSFEADFSAVLPFVLPR